VVEVRSPPCSEHRLLAELCQQSMGGAAGSQVKSIKLTALCLAKNSSIKEKEHGIFLPDTILLSGQAYRSK
jgi:hypothetical protein